MEINIADLRKEYVLQQLDEKDINTDPIEQFLVWLNEAINAEVMEPTAMALSTTSNDFRPSSRIVLLKKVDSDGFVFYSNYDSKKGKHVSLNPFVSLLFFWPELERQVRVEGRVEKINENESDKYFSSRPLLSKISAAVSPQSNKIPNREYIENLISEFRSKHIDVNRPANWGGYRVIPDLVEFWQGRKNRLHDRIQYRLTENRWIIERLAP